MKDELSAKRAKRALTNHIREGVRRLGPTPQSAAEFEIDQHFMTAETKAKDELMAARRMSGAFRCATDPESFTEDMQAFAADVEEAVETHRSWVDVPSEENRQAAMAAVGALALAVGMTCAALDREWWWHVIALVQWPLIIGNVGLAESYQETLIEMEEAAKDLQA